MDCFLIELEGFLKLSLLEPESAHIIIGLRIVGIDGQCSIQKVFGFSIFFLFGKIPGQNGIGLRTVRANSDYFLELLDLFLEMFLCRFCESSIIVGIGRLGIFFRGLGKKMRLVGGICG